MAQLSRLYARRTVLRLLSAAAALSGAPLPGAHAMTVGDHGMIVAKPGPGQSYGYRVRSVQFESAGETLSGVLFSPERQGASPGVVALGPFGFVKEQAPAGYAAHLARDGFSVLIFDPRYSGESTGHPRRLESPKAKIADARAALAWLSAQDEVDASRIGVLGICQGASEMIAVGSEDERVRAVALVSGQYLYRENLLGFFGGGGPTLDERIARGQSALARFNGAGEIEYLPVVSPEDRRVALPWPPIHAWYQPWTTAKWGEPSRWENRYAAMSDAEVWSFDVEQFARKLRTPTLLVHGEQSDGGVASAQHIHDAIPASQKRLVVVKGAFHTRFYDDPIVLGPAAAEVAAWFGRHLG